MESNQMIEPIDKMPGAGGQEEALHNYQFYACLPATALNTL